MKNLLFSVLLLFSGCSTPEKPHTRIEFIILNQDIKNFPVIASAFNKAIDEWTKILPIECALYSSDHLFYRPGLIWVDITHKPNDRVLGIWKDHEDKIIIYAPLIRSNKDLATSVCLHELGHVFGLPHLVNSYDQNGFTGDKVVKRARQYLMYPVLHYPKLKISDLEKNLVIENLLGDNTRSCAICLK